MFPGGFSGMNLQCIGVLQIVVACDPSRCLAGRHPVLPRDQPTQQIDKRIERFVVYLEVIVKGFNHRHELRGGCSIIKAGPTIVGPASF
jgi:hypothetical protein